MWRRLPQLSLVRRIIVSVAIGLTLIFALYLSVALWTIEESAEAAFSERVTLAKVLAERVDEVLAHELATLNSEATTIEVERADQLTDDHRHRLSGLRHPLGDFGRIAVVDVDGTTVWSAPSVSSEGATSGEAADTRLGIMAMDKPGITSATVGRSTYARLAVLLTGLSGNPSGMLVGELDPADSGLALLPRRGIDGGVVAQLMDTEGRLITGAGVPGPRAAREHAMLMADLIQTQVAGYRIHEAGPDAPYARHVVAYAPVSVFPSWGVAVEQPIDLVLAMPRQIERRLAITGAASFALIIALAWLDVRRVVRPLKRLTEATERIAAGKLDEALRVDRDDEVGVLARAFETMRLQLRASLEKVQNLAVLEERERIAREMHDGLGQVLGYVNTKTLAVSRLLELGKVDEARAQVTQLEAAAKDVYADVREAVLGLRVAFGPGHDFIGALREYVYGFEQQSGIAVTLDVSPWPSASPLPLAAEIQLIRIVQEALANVRKHAGAESAVVRLTAEESLVRLTVEDNGRGFDQAGFTREGWPRFGLQTMRERADAIGGTFVVHSAPGVGTRVQISIPVGSTPTMADAEVVNAATARTSRG